MPDLENDKAVTDIETKLRDMFDESAPADALLVIAETLLKSPRPPSHEDVALVAFELWLINGSPVESTESDWHAAEALFAYFKPAPPVTPVPTEKE